MMSSRIRHWITHPHPLIVGLILTASLLALWRAPLSNTQMPQSGILGTLREGTIVDILSEKESLQRVPGARTTLIQQLSVRLEDSGATIQLENDLTPLATGDRIYMQASFEGTPDASYTILDYKRSTDLWWLFVLFVAIVFLVSGIRKGVSAIAGMVVAVAVVFVYLIPAILNGAAPMPTGLFCAGLILLGTFYISYGFNRMSLAALAGIGITLLLVAGVGSFVVGDLHFTGYGDEAALYLNQATNYAVNLPSLLIIGIIIAAIGVLDDVAITQASTVFELAAASPARGWKLFRHAMRVGTDHISAVTNTLVLAYAGAALPLILLLHISQFPLGFTIGGEQIAEEIVRTLVSSMGLVLAVPLTTAVAVFFVRHD